MSQDEKNLFWGKSTWMFFHTLAEKVDEEKYKVLKYELIAIVRQICSNLPCPECAAHASRFISTVRIETIPTKHLFKSMLFLFHNQVNARIGKPQFMSQQTSCYKHYSLGISLQNFLTFYAKRYNGTIQAGIMSTETKRRRIAISVNQWIKNNWTSFN